MLLELDEDILEEVALLFRDRLLNQDASTWNISEHHMVALIPKPNKDATLIKNLRPIAVLPVIYKWYIRCLGLLCQDELQNVSVFQTTQPLHLDDKLKKFYLRYVNWFLEVSKGSCKIPVHQKSSSVQPVMRVSEKDLMPFSRQIWLIT